jgi:P4 family phage/plasmid primase-like protien
MSFGETAPKYWAKGLSVIPVEPRSKTPAVSGWPGYLGGVLSPTRQEQWCEQYEHHNIGLLLGSAVGDHYVIAIDVDDNYLPRPVKGVIGEPYSAKRGKKGLTMFVRSPVRLKSCRLQAEDGSLAIDILSSGRMTVMPPSIHPDTGEPYIWEGTPLVEIELERLPIFDARMLEIIKTLVRSPHTKVILSGKQTHDAGLQLAAQLVAAGASDEQIMSIFQGLLPDGYDGNSAAELPEWIQSARQKGFHLISKLPIDERIAQIIEKELSPLVFVSGDGFLRYSEGFWETVSDTEIDRLAKSHIIENKVTRGLVRPMLHNVRGVLALNVERQQFGSSPVRRICVRNGTLNVVTGQLEPHSPEHELRFKLDVEFDPEAACPTYEQHITEVLQGDLRAIETFDEFAGLSLVHDMSHQKALYLMGPAGGGKSTLLKSVEMMHDPRAVSVAPLSKLENERYITDAARKLICISYDVQGGGRIFGETFTRVTGGDAITTRRLYEEVDGRVIPTVRFIGSMNLDAPPSAAAADALERRLIFLRCGEKPTHIDPQRFQRLSAERPGILSRYVRALQRLLDRGMFNPPPESADDVAEYLHEQEPFETFAAENLLHDPKNILPITAIAAEYNEWAKGFGARVAGLGVISRKLRAFGFERVKQPNQEGQGPKQRFVYARLKRMHGGRIRDDV